MAKKTEVVRGKENRAAVGAIEILAGALAVAKAGVPAAGEVAVLDEKSKLRVFRRTLNRRGCGLENGVRSVGHRLREGVL